MIYVLISLCIIQDSEDDWRVEAARMGDVYKYAWCNIAATEVQDDKWGLFTDRNQSQVEVMLPKVFWVEPKSPKEKVKTTMWDIRHPNPSQQRARFKLAVSEKLNRL
jgi:hypothetical protein